MIARLFSISVGIFISCNLGKIILDRFYEILMLVLYLKYLLGNARLVMMTVQTSRGYLWTRSWLILCPRYFR